MTSLLGGTRVSKDNERIEAYGTIDELNAFLGMVADLEINEERVIFLRMIQSRLFTAVSSLAAESEKAKAFKPDLTKEDITALEQAIDKMNEDLPPLKSFILPGGHQLVSAAHIARTVCRRAERLTVGLVQEGMAEEIVMRYLNRLSDYLFVLARKQGRELKIDEIPWKPKR